MAPRFQSLEREVLADVKSIAPAMAISREAASRAAASFCIDGSACVYVFKVTSTRLCPSRSCTTFKGTPDFRIRVAQESDANHATAQEGWNVPKES